MNDAIDVQELNSKDHDAHYPACLVLSKLLLLDVQVKTQVTARDELCHQIEVSRVLEGVAHVAKEWAHHFLHKPLLVDDSVDCMQPVDIQLAHFLNYQLLSVWHPLDQPDGTVLSFCNLFPKDEVRLCLPCTLNESLVHDFVSLTDKWECLGIHRVGGE